jgi:hypothetical protein
MDETGIAPFSKIGFDDDCPFVSPDDTKLFFVSRRPVNGGDNSLKENIWYLTRQGKIGLIQNPLMLLILLHFTGRFQLIERVISILERVIRKEKNRRNFLLKI